LDTLQEYGRQHQVPLVAIHSAGFYGYFRISLPGVFPIVDTHPDETATADLRLLTPWPELSQFAGDMTRDIDNLDAHEHGHLPLVVILLHYLEVWKAGHGGSLPISYSDKGSFRTLVSGAMRTANPEGGEENFEEAVSAVMKHITTPSIPSSLEEVFNHDHGNTVSVTHCVPKSLSTDISSRMAPLFGSLPRP
jgi:amyloid beta precursor protein binding protein 1